MAVFSTMIKDRINTALAALFADLTTRQETYRAGLETIVPATVDQAGNPIPAVKAVRNRYWQGIRNPVVIPADGLKIAPDLTLRPSYQPESWADLGVALPATSEVSLEITQYVSPTGPGWALAVTVVYNGRVWQRSRAIGPEAAQRTTNWTDATPGATP